MPASWAAYSALTTCSFIKKTDHRAGHPFRAGPHPDVHHGAFGNPREYRAHYGEGPERPFATIKLDLAVIKLNGQRFTYRRHHGSIEGQVLDLEAEASHAEPAGSFSEAQTDEEGRRRACAFTILAAPIAAKDRILGTITLGRKVEQRDVANEQQDQYLLGMIANYISSGLETRFSTSSAEALRELGDAQRRMIENEKLRGLGEMTANIAHEIKNPLVVIGGFTKRLAKTARLDPAENRYVEIITKEVTRLEAILTEILNYVKETSLLFEKCEVNSLLDEIIYLLSSDKGWAAIKIAKQYEPDLPLAFCDVQQIKQVFINMLMNSFEAMHGRGTITITTERVILGDKQFLAIRSGTRAAASTPLSSTTSSTLSLRPRRRV